MSMVVYARYNLSHSESCSRTELAGALGLEANREQVSLTVCQSLRAIIVRTTARPVA
jgi:hypothetical protein